MFVRSASKGWRIVFLIVVAAVLALGALLLVLAMDDDDDGGNANASPRLEGTRWELRTIDGQAIPHAARGTPYLSLADGRASGFSGCNSFGGDYELEGDRLTVGDLAQTKVACPDIGDLETRFLGTLSGKAVTARVSGTRLTIEDDAGPSLEFDARLDGDPRGELTRVSWRLITLNGRSDDSIRQFDFTFGDDSRFSASGPCGPIEGRFERDGLAIDFTVENETPETCAEPDRTVDRDVRAALATVTTYLVDAGTVTFSGEGGVQIVLDRPGEDFR